MHRSTKKFNAALLLLQVVLLSALMGCAASRCGSGWGRDATALPGWRRIGEAAGAAALDPYTWVPTAGAAVFGLTGLDESVSDWASENTPVFGSRDCAARTSDDLRDASEACWIVSMILAPSGNELGEILKAKGKGAALELAAVYSTKELTDLLKHTTGRVRPNGMDDRSFPSGHTSGSFVFSSLARTNLEWFVIHEGARKALQYGLTTLAAGTGWARIEAGVHYPSDVLFGAALGNFLSVFFTRAFLGGEDAPPVGLSLSPSSYGANLYVHMTF